ncbi:MAG: hypothetical protein U9Q07_07430 [Planctomycetota bacterium]|nr:hypothetical protein [Planctomycetota bacterium]
MITRFIAAIFTLALAVPTLSVAADFTIPGQSKIIAQAKQSDGTYDSTETVLVIATGTDNSNTIRVPMAPNGVMADGFLVEERYRLLGDTVCVKRKWQVAYSGTLPDNTVPWIDLKTETKTYDSTTYGIGYQAVLTKVTFTTPFTTSEPVRMRCVYTGQSGNDTVWFMRIRVTPYYTDD